MACAYYYCNDCDATYLIEPVNENGETICKKCNSKRIDFEYDEYRLNKDYEGE